MKPRLPMQVHDGTKITESVVAIDEELIEGNAAHISAESIEKPNVESSEGIVAESSEEENDIEQVTEDSGIRCLAPESVEGPVKNLEESTGEVCRIVNLFAFQVLAHSLVCLF